MKKISIFLLLVLFASFTFAREVKEVKPVKNVILMIPDGTSLGVYSAARWYKIYNNLGEGLNIDPYITGTVSTFSSNAPIGDSAPTTSAYMTGIPSRTGHVSIYPVHDPGNDLYPIDSTMAYQPLTTILEASRIENNKATGLVVTCEFPHATPADCAAHHYNRSNYKALAPQMAYQNLDVMFGGGNGILTDDIKQHFRNKEINLIQDDRNAMLDYSDDNPVWALFGDRAMPYDIDRNPEKFPSLAEMTQKAIDILSKKEKGFFLMVEGSQVDWAAHGNDPVGIITEYLAFDEAVGRALDFAKEDGETAVVILSDHGNSGFSIGKNDCPGYDRLSIERLFGAVSKFKLTASGMEAELLKIKPEGIKEEFKKYTEIDLTDDELESLLTSKNYKMGGNNEDAKTPSLQSNILKILNSKMCFGFTTGGHTGEEVLLAAYHPEGTVPMGHLKNTDINDYLFKVSGLKTPLPEMTQQIFAKHTDVFADMTYSIEGKDSDIPVLMVKKGDRVLKVPAFSSVATLDGKTFDLGSVTVYIDRNDTFYLPRHLKDVF
jgi:alkaline phosphatase